MKILASVLINFGAVVSAFGALTTVLLGLMVLSVVVTSAMYLRPLSWSPSGDQLAFSAEDEDRTEIWLIDSDGANPRKLVESSKYGGVRDWGWTVDAHELWYKVWMFGEHGFFAISVDGGEPRSISEATFTEQSLHRDEIYGVSSTGLATKSICPDPDNIRIKDCFSELMIEDTVNDTPVFTLDRDTYYWFEDGITFTTGLFLPLIGVIIFIIGLFIARSGDKLVKRLPPKSPAHQTRQVAQLR